MKLLVSCAWVTDADVPRYRHFYAFECPRLLVRDMQAMFGKGGGAYGLVTGRDGYATGNG